MMKRVVVVGLAMAMLSMCITVMADDCGLINGSFEDDGPIDNVALQEPNGWSVDVPASKFFGYVYRDWATEGLYNLTLKAMWFQNFDAGDTAMVSQQVYLTDVNEIIFDAKLTTDGSAWEPGDCTAVVMIDDDVVWEPNSAVSDMRAEYINERYGVEGKYRDGNPHTLSFGIRVNVAGSFYKVHITHWDFIRCTLFCQGLGIPPGDLNRDCYVNWEDFELLADVWLAEGVDPYHTANLVNFDDYAGYGTVDFLDFAVYAGTWAGDMSDLQGFAGKWLADDLELEDVHNVYPDNDVQPRALINFFDFAMFAETWPGSISEQEPEE